MDKRLLGMVAALLMASAAPAVALDNSSAGGGRCECFCDAGSIGGFNTYDNPGSCCALENRTCNIEDPATGLIRSGRTLGCSPERSTSSQAQIQDGAVLDPGDGGGQPGRPGLVSPLLNGGTFQQR
jgi:hypothetical protein